MSVLLRADDLTLGFTARRGPLDTLRGGRRTVQALAGVTLAVNRGETLAVVSESGCGKSTLARALVRLLTLDGGQIDYDGQDVRALRGEALRRYNRRVQMVFQDPYGSLNPRMTVGETIGEALQVHRMVPAGQVGARVKELLHLVRLPAGAMDRQPHEFSGGQRQRIAIARALAVEPELLIADEIVSALDTRRRDAESALRGELPSPLQIPPSCPFHPRCPRVFDRCRVERPAMRVRLGPSAGHLTAGYLTAGHLAACHLVEA